MRWQSATDQLIDALTSWLGVRATKFVSTTSPPVSAQPDEIRGLFALVSMLFAFVAGSVRVWWKCKTKGVKSGLDLSSDIADSEVAQPLWVDFLGEALKQGKFVSSPESLIVPRKGVAKIQEGLGIQKKGVSAKKVVVSLR